MSGTGGPWLPGQKTGSKRPRGQLWPMMTFSTTSPAPKGGGCWTKNWNQRGALMQSFPVQCKWTVGVRPDQQGVIQNLRVKVSVLSSSMCWTKQILLILLLFVCLFVCFLFVFCCCCCFSFLFLFFRTKASFEKSNSFQRSPWTTQAAGEPVWPSGKVLSPFLIGRMFVREPGWKYLRRSYIRGPKSFAQHVLGTFSLFDEHCLWLAKIRALLWMRKKYIYIK